MAETVVAVHIEDLRVARDAPEEPLGSSRRLNPEVVFAHSLAVTAAHLSTDEKRWHSRLQDRGEASIAR